MTDKLSYMNFSVCITLSSSTKTQDRTAMKDNEKTVMLQLAAENRIKFNLQVVE
jgi:hypothetical protein